MLALRLDTERRRSTVMGVSLAPSMTVSFSLVLLGRATCMSQFCVLYRSQKLHTALSHQFATFDQFMNALV